MSAEVAHLVDPAKALLPMPRDAEVVPTAAVPSVEMKLMMIAMATTNKSTIPGMMTSIQPAVKARGIMTTVVSWEITSAEVARRSILACASLDTPQSAEVALPVRRLGTRICTMRRPGSNLHPRPPSFRRQQLCPGCIILFRLGYWHPHSRLASRFRSWSHTTEWEIP